MKPFLELLTVVDRVKDDERYLRTYYADIQTVGKILFAEGQTARGAKRMLRKLRDTWEASLRKFSEDPNNPAAKVLASWCKTTDSYWPGLFHTYSNPYIPGTNNATEQTIKEAKSNARILSGNPNPAHRFLRHGAINAVFIGMIELPGVEFLRSLTHEDIAKAKATIRSTNGRWVIIHRARHGRAEHLNRLEERWKQAEHPPPFGETMDGSAESAS